MCAVCYDVTVKRESLVDLRRKTNEIARGAAGEAWPPGLAEMERRGLIQRAHGDLLDVVPVRMPKGKRRPSDLIREGRGR